MSPLICYGSPFSRTVCWIKFQVDKLNEHKTREHSSRTRTDCRRDLHYKRGDRVYTHRYLRLATLSPDTLPAEYYTHSDTLPRGYHTYSDTLLIGYPTLGYHTLSDILLLDVSAPETTGDQGQGRDLAPEIPSSLPMDRQTTVKTLPSRNFVNGR